MEELSAFKYVEKKSRFYSHLYKIDSESDIELLLKAHRKTYKKAVHHCYAYILKTQHVTIDGYRDDGEVGHPGKIIHELLITNNLNSHVLIVSRIFGGIKLGVGGVGRAFRTAADHTITHAPHTKKGQH